VQSRALVDSALSPRAKSCWQPVLGVEEHDTFCNMPSFFDATNSKKRGSGLFSVCLDQLHSQNVSSFTPTLEAQAGLPPGFTRDGLLSTT